MHGRGHRLFLRQTRSPLRYVLTGVFFRSGDEPADSRRLLIPSSTCLPLPPLVPPHLEHPAPQSNPPSTFSDLPTQVVQILGVHSSTAGGRLGRVQTLSGHASDVSSFCWGEDDRRCWTAADGYLFEWEVSKPWMRSFLAILLGGCCSRHCERQPFSTASLTPVEGGLVKPVRAHINTCRR